MLERKLRTIHFFKHSTEFESFKRGAVIFNEGEPGTHMYVVRNGTVEVDIDGRIIETLDPGDILGEMALLDDRHRSATAIALTDCELVPIDLDRFLYLIRETPNFALEVMEVMAARLRRMDHQTDVIRRRGQKSQP